MSDPSTSPFTFESVLLLSLLANFRKYEARNPYLVRIEDFVDEVVMSRIARVVLGMCGKGVGEYVAITDDQPASFVASLTSLVWSLNITELLGSFSLSLPPVPESSSSIRKGKGKEVDEVAGPKKGRKEEGAFSEMPPQVVVVLLPFYDLLNSNKVFSTLVFAETDDGRASPPSLPFLANLSQSHSFRPPTSSHLLILLHPHPRRHLLPRQRLPATLPHHPRPPRRRRGRETHGPGTAGPVVQAAVTDASCARRGAESAVGGHAGCGAHLFEAQFASPVGCRDVHVRAFPFRVGVGTGADELVNAVFA